MPGWDRWSDDLQPVCMTQENLLPSQHPQSQSTSICSSTHTQNLLLVFFVIPSCMLSIVSCTSSHCRPCPLGPLDRRQPGHLCSTSNPTSEIRIVNLSFLWMSQLCDFLKFKSHFYYWLQEALDLPTYFLCLPHFLFLLSFSVYPSCSSVLLTLVREKRVCLCCSCFCLRLCSLHSTDSRSANCSRSISSHSPRPFCSPPSSSFFLPAASSSGWATSWLIRIGSLCCSYRSADWLSSSVMLSGIFESWRQEGRKRRSTFLFYKIGLVSFVLVRENIKYVWALGKKIMVVRKCHIYISTLFRLYKLGCFFFFFSNNQINKRCQKLGHWFNSRFSTIQ